MKNTKFSFGKRILLGLLRFPLITSAIIIVPALIKVIYSYKIQPEFILLVCVFSFIIWMIIAFVIYEIAKNYITFIGAFDDDFTMILLRISQDGKIIETGETLWGKENEHVYRVINPGRSWKASKKISTSGKITSSTRNTKTIIPYTLTVKYDEDFDWQEVYDRMIKEFNVTSFEAFIHKVFMLSVDKSKEEVDEFCRQFAKGKLIKEQLLERIIEMVDLPKGLLKNFKDEKVYLDDPTARACKDASCGK